MNVVCYGVKKYIKVSDEELTDVESCKKCCFHKENNSGEIYCQSPCDVRFDGCGDGHFHWIKK